MPSERVENKITGEFKGGRDGQFVTLTFNDESAEQIAKDIDSEDANEIATRAIRMFTDRWRKKYKKNPRYWLITELGHKGTYRISNKERHKTERLHIHGIIFESEEKFGNIKWVNSAKRKAGRISDELNRLWKYGNCVIGHTELNKKICHYVTKYITKEDTEHKGFKGKIFASKGIGKAYMTEARKKMHEWKMIDETIDYYVTDTGKKISLPKYYKERLYTGKQKRIMQMTNNSIKDNKLNNTNVRNWDAERNIKLIKESQIGLTRQSKIRYKWKDGVILDGRDVCRELDKFDEIIKKEETRQIVNKEFNINNFRQGARVKSE